MSSKYQKREEIQFPFHKFHFYISASCEHHLQTGIGTEGTFCNCSLSWQWSHIREEDTRAGFTFTMKLSIMAWFTGNESSYKIVVPAEIIFVNRFPFLLLYIHGLLFPSPQQNEQNTIPLAACLLLSPVHLLHAMKMCLSDCIMHIGRIWLFCNLQLLRIFITTGNIKAAPERLLDWALKGGSLFSSLEKTAWLM